MARQFYLVQVLDANLLPVRGALVQCRSPSGELLLEAQSDEQGLAGAERDLPSGESSNVECLVTLPGSPPWMGRLHVAASNSQVVVCEAAPILYPYPRRYKGG